MNEKDLELLRKEIIFFLNEENTNTKIHSLFLGNEIISMIKDLLRKKEEKNNGNL